MQYIDIDFNNKTILITGGGGFIGSNLAFYFQENYPNTKVIVFDRFRSEEIFSNGNLKSFGHFKNLISFKGIVISGDITNKDDLERIKEFDIDYIFHEAAISDTTVLNQKIMIDTNVNAFKDLLDIAKEKNSTVIYASSAATYGNSKVFKVGSENPNNVYGFSKFMMDNLAKIYHKENPNIRIVGLRYFNVYGSREFYKDKTSSMVLQFGLQLLRGESAKLFKESDKILRDFIFIEDVIQANIKACRAKSGIYNVGTGKARSFQDIVDILKQELNINREDTYIVNPYKKQYQYFTEANINETKKELGYNPRFSLKDGIKAYLPEIIRIFEEEL